MSRNLRLLLMAVFVLGIVPALHAQNAVVLGTVYDATGAPAPGITVLLENKNTGFTRIATTGADGSYSIPEVPPADSYIITASKEGATLDVRQNISVNVGDERSILPPLREPAAQVTPTDTTPTDGAAPKPAGPTAPPVQTGPAPTVRNETTQTSIGAVITGDQLRSLPLYNRNFLVLGLLTANTHDVEAGSALTGASFSISGQRASSNNFVLDGSDNVASSSNQAIPFQVNDAIQEFRVTSSTANAEYGRGSGGVVSVVTRRGTNQLHGAVFGYFAHDALNSESPISLYRGSGFDRAATYAGSPTAAPAVPVFGASSAVVTSYNQYVATARANGYCTNSINAGFAGAPNTCVASGAGRNDMFNPAAILGNNDARKQPFFSKQFGANMGGAIIKDKLFAFGSYEATMIDNPNLVFERVPSAFDKTVKAGLNTPAANAADPNYRMAQQILALYPAANVVAVPGVLEFYRGQAENYTNVHNALVRMDWSKSDRNQFNLRYAGQLLRQLHDDTLPSSSVYAGNGAFRNAQNQNVAFTYTHSFSPKLINEVRANVTQFRIVERPQDRGFDAKTLGLAGSAMPTINLAGLDTQYSGARRGASGAFGGWYDAFWSTVATTPMQPSLDGFFPFARLGAPLNAPGTRRDTNWAVSDNLTWGKGKHSFKFGGDFRYIQNRLDNGGFTRGVIASGNIGEFTSDSETCNTGLVTGAIACDQAFRTPSFDYSLNQQPSFAGLFNSQNFSGYVQDSWRPRPGLTINMGARYEYFGVPSEANNQVWNFDPAANGLVQQGGSAVFDPFGYRCGSGSPILDSVIRDRSAGQSVGWTCSPSSQGRIVKQDMSDFAGRFGIAWDVKGDGKTVIRAGIGIFYDQLPVNYMSQLLFSRPTTLNTANPRYIYGQNFLGNFVPTGQANTCSQCGLGNRTANPANLQPLFQSASSPFGLVSRDFRSSSTPYTRQNNVTIQRQITPNVVAEIGYIGSASRRLPTVYNRAYDNEWFCTVSKLPVTGIPGATQPTCDNFSFFPNFTMANVAESSYHSLMARARVVQFHGLRLNATYTWSKALDNSAGSTLPLVPTPLFTQIFGLRFFGLGNPFGFGLGRSGTILGKSATTIDLRGISITTGDVFTESSVTTTGAGQIFVSRYGQPQNPHDFLRGERGPSDFNTTHRGVADFNYDLPFAKDNKYLGGWTIAGILAVQSGQPFSIYSGPIFGEVTQRANASNVTMTGDPERYINGAFTLPGTRPVAGGFCFFAQGATLYQGTAGEPCTGNSGRNAFTGPAFVSMDMAIQKAFKILGEGKELTFRTEAFNVFNRANFYNPISVLSENGLTLNPDFGQIKSAHQPRQLQFAVRFTF